MAKVTLPHIQSGYLSAEKLNEALDTIEAAFNNTLSRDGSIPNSMEATLDMNSHRIINLPVPNSDHEPLTYGAAKAMAEGWVVQKVEQWTATAGQTEFVLTYARYEPGTNNLAVFVNGIRLFPPDFVEDSPTKFTLASALTGGEKVVAVTNDFVATLDAPDPISVPWNILTGVPVYATRWPTFAEVTDKPATYTPATHTHSADQITSGRLADARRGVYVQSSAPSLGAGDAGALWFW